MPSNRTPFQQRDASYDMQQQVTRGTRVVVLQDTYSGRPIGAGETGVVSSIINAGFRGIECSIVLDADGHRAVGVSLGNVEVAR